MPRPPRRDRKTRETTQKPTHDRRGRTNRKNTGERRGRTGRQGAGGSASHDWHDRTSRKGTGERTADDRHDRTSRKGTGERTADDRRDRTSRKGTGEHTADDRHDRTSRKDTGEHTADDRREHQIRDADEHRQESGDDFVFGRKPVLHALRSGRTINRLLAAKGAHGADLDEIFELARQAGVPFDVAERIRLDRQADGANHQGVIAVFAARPYTDFGDLLQTACSQDEPAFLVFLDGVQDPHNLGAIIRSIHAVGAAGVVIERRRCAPLTGSVAKASAGSVDHVPVCRVSNLRHAMVTARERGLWLTGLEPDGDTDFTEIDYSGPLGLVIGGEAKGLRPGVRDACDFHARIPLGRLEIGSLNASVAAGLVLYEVLRQRTTRD